MDRGGRLRTGFVAGLRLVTPPAVTVVVLQFAFVRTAQVLDPLVRATQPTNHTGNVEVVAQLLAAVLVVGAITLLGYVASWRLGERLFGGVERAVRLVPVVRTVYFGVREVSDSLTPGSSRYGSVVTVAFPRRGVYAVGVVTNPSPEAVRTAADESLYNVCIPTSPNPTAGTLALVPESDIRRGTCRSGVASAWSSRRA